jgi:natural product biosynthesis luciferase-like monooxygenase protein
MHSAAEKAMNPFTAIVIGDRSLLIQCAEHLLERGHRISAVVTRSAEIGSWAAGRDLPVLETGPDLAERLAAYPCDWLFSIANLNLLPEAVLDRAARGAINFHDGPLPRYAGLNAPVWARINGEAEHGVTWHLIEKGVDQGDIVAQRLFPIDPSDTALTLNARCYEAAYESFGDLIASLEKGPPERRAQDLSQRSYFGLKARPAAGGRLDFSQDATALIGLVRALDHGGYWNPVCRAKIELRGQVCLVGSAETAPRPAEAAPGAVLAVADDSVAIACGTDAVTLRDLADVFGRPLRATALAAVGDNVPSPFPETAETLHARISATARGEFHWRSRLRDFDPARIPDAGIPASPRMLRRALAWPPALAGDDALAAVAAWAARICDAGALDIAYHDDAIGAAAAAAPGYVSTWTSLRFDAGASESEASAPYGVAAADFANELARARTAGAFALDIVARDPDITPPETPDIAVAIGVDAAPVDGACCTVAFGAAGATLIYDAARLDDAMADSLARRLETLAAAVSEDRASDLAVARLPLLDAAERDLVLRDWNDTRTTYDNHLCVHEMVAHQAVRTPDAVAVVFEDRKITYAELDARANKTAHVLREMGVGPDVLVGLHAPRSIELVVGAVAIQKAGGAYVPLDPAYPADRIALYLEDSAAPVVLTHSAVADALPQSVAERLVIDRDGRVAAAPETPVDGGAQAHNLAYVIYTSGSTGRPKGVMIEHRNVANFFAGMDDRIGRDGAGTWLAVTSLSFDISVLELFYTLARGFTVVLAGDEHRALVAGGAAPAPRSDRFMDFSLYFWGNDDGVGPKKYALLLEAAKFADRNGFTALWTPERHFHAFGGPYPNPSVTGAAVAAVTENLEVRAGSCVAPLHHPIRIAEEWAVIDNLTNGRTGLAIASGWQPDDFVLRPENTPPANKTAMLESIDIVRRLWRGEAVEFPKADGSMHAVVTQPRPVSKEVPIWVTTAGNPQTWRDAAANGANVLTHLLGQSVDEVAAKIALYRDALREAGHDPGAYKVTLMLHTFVGRDREQVRETVREPMKDYLRSAAALIKQYAWAFPAFKRPAGASSAFDLDLETLTEEELDGVLEFAFLRYFEDSGLFGTVEDCLARVEELKEIGVDEIACLVDYGVPTPLVLENLYPLAEVVRRANGPVDASDGDWSIAAQIARHGVTHLQCTPSMARMICMNAEARDALGKVKRIMLGGEPLPGTLVEEIETLTGATIENMYGPTETTIWSSTEHARPCHGVVNIGRPIANTRLYVLNGAGEPAPVGVAGELYIGGAGVARGYLGRDALTAERFMPDPFHEATPGEPTPRMYRTGDLVRWRPDGRLDFLGRLDHQIKIRGYRIELGEIEAHVGALEGVREAVVLAREDNPGDVRLVAYVTADRAVAEATMREALRALLPEHMIPAHVVVLDAFPLTPNRKIDRKALPAPGAVRKTAARPTAAPAPAPNGNVAETIAAIWKRVLGVSEVGEQDNFFDLGGHSLLAVQAHRELREAFGADRLSITDVFRYPTLGGLATHLGAPPATAPAQDEPADAASDRGQARRDAMARRREMRAGRQMQPT